MTDNLGSRKGWRQAKFDGGRRRACANAVLCWAIAASVWGLQLVVVFWPQAKILRQLFPDWPLDLEYGAYLRGIALADVVFLQPLSALTGVGLWQMRRWGLMGGLAVAGAAVYFGILQVAAELFGGSRYHLYGMGALGQPFGWAWWAGCSIRRYLAFIALEKSTAGETGGGKALASSLCFFASFAVRSPQNQILPRGDC